MYHANQVLLSFVTPIVYDGYKSVFRDVNYKIKDYAKKNLIFNLIQTWQEIANENVTGMLKICKMLNSIDLG